MICSSVHAGCSANGCSIAGLQSASGPGGRNNLRRRRGTRVVALRFVPPAMRERVFARTLRGLRVGDSIEDLRRALPGKFDFETTGTSGQMGADLVYRIEFTDGRITAIDLHRR